MPKSIEIPGPPPRIPLTLREVTSSPGGLFRLKLDPLPMPWHPGDCIAVYAPGSGKSRPYSLAGGTGEPWTELLVRRIEGGLVSDGLTQLSPGATLEVSPPFGWFRPAEPEDAAKIYLATGSGIAPFWSAIRSGGKAPSRVFWGVRDAGEILCPDAFPSLDIWISRGKPGAHHAGRLLQGLESLVLEEGVHVYACGLDRMIEDSAEILRGRGLPEDRFHRECFFTA